MDARARLGRPALLAVGLLVAAVLLFQVVQSRIGVGLSSDSYSYLAWAERLLSEGKLDHTPYDFTAPKPLELVVATVGNALGRPVAFFGIWAVLSYLGAVLAAAALARRFAGWPAAVAAAVLAATMPALVRAGWAGDSTVPYAACIVGVAALAPGRIRQASALLGLAGLLRPEAWGLAAIHAALTWRRASRDDRIAAVSAAIVPPALWLSFDWIATGDPLYGAHATERFGVVPIPLQRLPELFRHLIPELVGWPLVVLGLAALGAGARKRPLDLAVVFPIALLLGLLVEVQLGLIGAEPLGRYAVGLFLFLPAGAAIIISRAPGAARLPVLAAGTAVCIALVWGPLQDARNFFDRRGALASQLQSQMAPAAEIAAGRGGLVATEAQWGGALAVFSDVPRERIVPVHAVGGEVDAADVGAYLVIARLQAEPRASVARSTRAASVPATRYWRLYEPG